jgi:hypothetical protein
MQNRDLLSLLHFKNSFAFIMKHDVLGFADVDRHFIGPKPQAMFFNLVLALGLSEVRFPSESAHAVSSAKKLRKRDLYACRSLM